MKKRELSYKGEMFPKLLSLTRKISNEVLELEELFLRILQIQSVTVAQMARILGYSRQHIQRIADRRVRNDFCAYRANFHHNKSDLLILTAKGQKFLEGKAEDFENMIRHRTHGISTENLGLAINVLELLTR